MSHRRCTMPILVMLAACSATAATEQVQIKKDIKPHFVALSAAQFAQLELRFTQVLNQDPASVDWSAVGMRQQSLANGVVAIHEEVKQGHGDYLFRPTAERPLFLQAPHRFADRLTGKIATRLFHTGAFRGAAWNTLHRRAPTTPSGGSSDLAHQEYSPFTAHGRAIAQVYPQAAIIQLHGFSKGKRKTTAGKDADMIVSSASRWPHSMALRLSQCLAQAGLGSIRLYPRDVQELGGTTNVTANALQQIGFPGFLHIEMSAQLRKLLVDDDTALEGMSKCLTRL